MSDNRPSPPIGASGSFDFPQTLTIRDIDNAMVEINDQIHGDEIHTEEKVVDEDLTGLVLQSAQEIANITVGQIAELTRQGKTKLTQELVTKIYDNANTVGKASMIKWIIKRRKSFMSALTRKAKGGSYKTITTTTKFLKIKGKAILDNEGNPITEVTVVEKVEELPPEMEALKYALGHIDGSNAIAIAKQTKSQLIPTNIDDVINKQ